MNTFVFFLNPEVPGFCPAMGTVFKDEGFSGPRDGAVLKSTVVSSYMPGGKIFGSDDVFTTDTVPLNTLRDENQTSPFMSNFLQPTRDGYPPRVAPSRCCTNLYF